MGCAKLRNTVKFQGDWRYGEQIYDWIGMMGGLSRWSRWRDGFKASWGRKGLQKRDEALPVGVPFSQGDDLTQTKHVLAMTKQIEELEFTKNQYQDAVKHNDMLMQFMLFANATSAQDAFHTVAARSLWEKDTQKLETSDNILLSCVMDLAIDFCTRIYLHQAYALIDDLQANTNATTNTTQHQKEPYCEIVEDCFINHFHSKECRPHSCPFHNAMGCAYVNACSDKRIQNEYAKVLGLEH